MRAPRTLRGRLALSALLTAGTAVLVLTTLFAVLLDRRLAAEAEDVLRSRAAAALATVDVDASGSLHIGDEDFDSALDTGIWVYDGDAAVERATGPADLQATADSLVGTDGRLVRRGEEPTTEFLSLAVRSGGRQVGTVVAAMSVEPYQRSARATVFAALALGVLLVVLVFLVARTVAARALKPVTEMTRQASDWSAGDTSLRFGAGDRPGELEDLATTLDAVLDRLSAVLRREQELSAEISHELRTPLAGIIAETELFAARPRSQQEAARAVAAIGDGARRVERILDTLLTAARADAQSARGRCDALAVARQLDVEVRAAGPVPWVGVDEAVVERLLSPLLDNARRYSDRVWVEAAADPGTVRLEVRDEGPGVPAGEEEAVFEPGHRAAPADGHDGAGLGLALARRLARAAGGDVTAVAGPGGRFVVSLPRA